MNPASNNQTLEANPELSHFSVLTYQPRMRWGIGMGSSTNLDPISKKIYLVHPNRATSISTKRLNSLATLSLKHLSIPWIPLRTNKLRKKPGGNSFFSSHLPAPNEPEDWDGKLHQPRFHQSIHLCIIYFYIHQTRAKSIFSFYSPNPNENFTNADPFASPIYRMNLEPSKSCPPHRNSFEMCSRVHDMGLVNIVKFIQGTSWAFSVQWGTKH